MKTTREDVPVARMAPNRLFEYVVKKYYRRILPGDGDRILHNIRQKPAEFRARIARHCNYPQIVEFLRDDPDPGVARAATQNEYWQLVGQFKPLLTMEREEKIKFIRQETLPNLLVFALCEQDIPVLQELFRHPGFSIQMLHLLYTYLLKRSEYVDVEAILRLMQRTITLRKRRIFKITAMFQEIRDDEPRKSIVKLLPYVLDEDDVVVRSAVNQIKQYEYPHLRAVLFQENPFGTDELDLERIWLLLGRLKTYYRLTSKPMREKEHSPLTPSYTQEEFLQDLKERKKMLLEYCGEHLSLPSAVLTVARAFLDPDPEVQEILQGIIGIDDLLVLISDPTFSQAVSYQVLKILKNYPDARIRRQVSEIFLQINERTRRQLREMELTVNAYFDIIFNSLGYPRIRQIRQAFKVLEAAKKLTSGFLKQNEESDLNFDEVFRLFGKISEFYQGKLMEIYLSMEESLILELKDVYEIVQLILKIPVEYTHNQGYTPSQESRIYFRMLHRARTVWRVTLGQYLGRLRELDEMIRRKWLHYIPQRTARQKMKEEMQQVIREMEREYKNEMNCHLQNSCRTCRKRPCAAERYLRQVEFFIGEFLEIVQEQEEMEEEFVSKAI